MAEKLLQRRSVKGGEYLVANFPLPRALIDMHNDTRAAERDLRGVVGISGDISVLGSVVPRLVKGTTGRAVWHSNRGGERLARVAVVVRNSFANDLLPADSLSGRDENHYHPETWNDMRPKFLQDSVITEWEIAAFPQDYTHITPDSLERAIWENGPTVVVKSIEGLPRTIDGQESEVAETLARTNTKVLCISWNGETDSAVPHDKEGGITPVTVRLLEEVAQRGVTTIIDGSHASERWQLEANQLIRTDDRFKNLIFVITHAGARTINDKTRNVTDTVLREVLWGASDDPQAGFFGIALTKGMLGGPSIHDYARTYEHVVSFDPTGGKRIGAGPDDNGSADTSLVEDGGKTIVEFYLNAAPALAETGATQAQIEDHYWRSGYYLLRRALQPPVRRS